MLRAAHGSPSVRRLPGRGAALAGCGSCWGGLWLACLAVPCFSPGSWRAQFPIDMGMDIFILLCRAVVSCRLTWAWTSSSLFSAPQFVMPWLSFSLGITVFFMVRTVGCFSWLCWRRHSRFTPAADMPLELTRRADDIFFGLATLAHSPVHPSVMLLTWTASACWCGAHAAAEFWRPFVASCADP